MKKRTNKDFIIVIIVIPVLLLLLFLSWSKSKEQISYTVENKSDAGFSIFYEALHKLNIPAEVTMKKLNNQSVDSIQIAPSPKFDIEDKDVQNWVSKGGILVYAVDEFSVSESSAKYTINPNTGINDYNIGKGHIITVNAYELTNKELANNTDISYKLLARLCGYNRKIYFNETYIFSGSDQKNLWNYMSLDTKMFLYQAVIVLIAFLWYKGKRFGKPIPYYEETERCENEYLYSVSNVFRQGKCYDIMLENYYRNFLKAIKLNDSEWIEYWENNNLSEYKKAKEVYDFMHSSYGNKKKKEYINIIRQLEYLTKYFKNRRESYWKILK